VDSEGVSEALLNVAQVYSAMIEHSDETMVLADSSKLGTRSLQQIIGLQSNLCLVTEKAPALPLLNAIRRSGADVIFEPDTTET
jgi:DeoR/GlpR family transcriptional regulator of sugar metabolism